MLRHYKETPRPAGLFGVRNTENDRLLVGFCVDLPAMLNRQRFQLEMGLHPDKELQADWDRCGPDAFAFEVLDELKPVDGSSSDAREDVVALHVMWIDKLTLAGQALYPSSTRST